MLVVTCVAVLLVAPSLANDPSIDDSLHRIMVGAGGSRTLPGPVTGLFSFVDGDVGRNRRLIQSGLLPWWAHPSLKVAFFRPLAAALHVIDHSLWPTLPALMQLHNMIWFAGTILVVGLFYRRLGSTAWIAGCATALYALDEAHGWAVGWVANRAALMATFFGVAALLCHDAWRRRGRLLGAFGAPILLAIGLLCGEMATGAVGYFVAYAVFRERGSLLRRASSLAPAAVVCGIWFATCRLLGFGVAHSGAYLDPLASPAGFILELPVRALIALLGQLTPVPAEASSLVPPFHTTHVVVAVILVPLLALAFFRLLRGNREAGFWATGMLLALAPICAGTPHNRNLWYVGLGAMGLVACYLSVVRASAVGRGSAMVAGFLVLFHFFLSPLALPVMARVPGLVGRMITRASETLPDAAFEDGRTLVIASTPNAYIFAINAVLRRFERDGRLPRRVRVLSSSGRPATLTRVDERTVEVAREDVLLPGTIDRLFRAEEVRTGATVVLDDVRITILRTGKDGRGCRVSFRFARNLDDASLVWVKWSGRRYRELAPPPVGQTTTLEAD